MPTFLRLFSGLLVLPLLAAGCPGPTPATTPPAGSWLVLLCRASDAPAEPQTVAFYEGLFDRSDSDGLWAYFDAISHQTVDISGSRVYGWFPMSVSTAAIAPSVRNNAMPVTRSQTAADCRGAALAGIIARGITEDPANYAGVITVINVPIDVGAATSRSVVIGTHAEEEVGFIAHEMLHILGLEHSFRMERDSGPDHVWASGTDAEYQDCWDMMSFRTCVRTFNSARGPQGPLLSGAYRERLGWLSAGRIWTPPAYPATTSTVTLTALDEPGTSGPLLARIETPRGAYVLEYRAGTGFDRGMGASGVLIREERNGRKTYLTVPASDNPLRSAGDVFTDQGNFIRITVDAVTATTATLTVNTAYAAAPAQMGERCGDKFRGEVIPCASGLQCRARQTGTLVSVDYFCLP